MSPEPIAIVGSACRFAGEIDSPAKLWEFLKDPEDLRQEIPKERFDTTGIYHQHHAYHGHSNVKHSYMLSQDPASFDAEFFGINLVEAKAMDPQQRLMLEVVYEAMEAAGMTIQGMSGSDTCVYAGSMGADYDAMGLRDIDYLPTYAAVGTSRAILSNRISYFFDWKGASVTIDTACSSSMVALHHAIQTLRSGDSGTAVVCGSNLILGPECYIIESTVKMLSPNGLSRMWDKGANGYARGEGLAALIIKPLSAALKANDHVRCIIRETGLNQDGATAGLTVPSPNAQRELIRKTYATAGLDLNCLADRPQYFEAHGTGTPAGDPVEAEAIYSAFVEDKECLISADSKQPLYVGSIKTVLGHTEGTAGLAAAMKAMLAIQNSFIPPNLHFEALNPAIEPFYKDLEIRRTGIPWPQLNSTQVRRASVNSFGFGGANAHAILESYDDALAPSSANKTANRSVFGPFVFSAASETALRGSIMAYIDYLATNNNCDACNLAYTLRERRSLLQYRLAISAKSCVDLKEKLISFVSGNDGKEGFGIVRTIPKIGNERGEILAVFTGQGAQYANMGVDIIHSSPFARRIIDRLSSYLLDLPEEDRPLWTLEEELLAETDRSRVGESSISQPLNTALQIMLVDLLNAAGVHFDAVVGHSSGEIAAAYAAGFLSARDAICISYYRGACCKYAKSPNGSLAGAMLAVGTTVEDAMDLCNDESLAGRICLAAVNSESSVTISGDSDAIEELAAVMEDEKKFHRRLRVDKAYHSIHMLACCEPYAQGMRRAGVTAAQRTTTSESPSCRWYSSVYDGKVVDDLSQLSGQYWLENLVKPVKFDAALSAAFRSSTSSFDAVVEIGPHPALEGPAAQIMQAILPKPVPYVGTLNRGDHATTSFSEALGFLWSHLDRRALDLAKFESKVFGDNATAFNLISDLPHYQWNHTKLYWHESRRSRQFRSRSKAVHALLGHVTAESGPHALRWKHLLKPSEMPWLQGHAVQNQVVFPAAGYLSSAIEAVRSLVPNDKAIQLIDIEHFVIHQAIPFQSEEDSVEVLIELTQISSRSDQAVTANFSYLAGVGWGSGSTDLSLVATAEVAVRIGERSSSLLPERQPEPPHMIDVRPQRMYDYLAKLEYNFSGPFRSLIELRRKLGFSRCLGKSADRSPDCSDLWVHPADLDAAFQAVNLACSYPGDEQIRHLHLPTRIANIRINPAAVASLPCAVADLEPHEQFQVDATWCPTDPLVPASGYSGDACLYFGNTQPQHIGIQMDNVVMKPIGDANDERKIYYALDYVPVELDGDMAATKLAVTREAEELMQTLRRIVHFYARQFDHDVPADSPVRTTEATNRHYLNFCQHITSQLKSGEAKWAKVEWLQDTQQDIMDAIYQLGPEAANITDVRLHLLVGQTMPRVFRGEADMLEELRVSGLLDDFYRYGVGLREATLWLAAIMKQLTDRSPHLRIMEVGAGTGSATKEILNTIGHSFDDYTFTDISIGFGSSMEYFAPWQDCMTFKTFNVEVDPLEQEFVEGEYDVIIASQVLHATSDLRRTVRNIRRLLKPGGWLLLGECSPDGTLFYAGGFIFGTLSGWWNGEQEGRVLSPFASNAEWDAILRETGFAGIEIMNPEHLSETFGITAIAAQAIDERIALLKTPLSSRGNLDFDEVIVLGGQTDPVAGVVDDLQGIFTSLGVNVLNYKSLDCLGDRGGNWGPAVISLVDVDQPVFKDVTAPRWEAFRKLFVGERSMLWVTCGRLKGELYSNMTVGFGRGAVNEEADFRLQQMDVADISQLDPRAIAETFVRFTNRTLLDSSSKNQILHTVESELVIDEKGSQLVPRLAHQPELNGRLCSVRREVRHQINLRNDEVVLEQNSSGHFLRRMLRFEKPEILGGLLENELIELRTLYSAFSAIRTPWGHRSLVLGVSAEGTKHLALTSSVTSVFWVPAHSTVQIMKDAPEAIQIISSVLTRLVTLAILGDMGNGQRAIVHSASVALAEALAAEATQRNVKVAFTSDGTADAQLPQTSTTSHSPLPPYSGPRQIRNMLDTNVACLVDLSQKASVLSNTLAALVPSFCRKEGLDTLFAPLGSPISECKMSIEPLKQYLVAALDVALAQKLTKASKAWIGLADVIAGAEDTVKLDPLQIVDWTRADSLPARVCRLDVVPMFKANRTYWLCGLSGPLGISICDWMIDRGVRHMVISSRNPRMEKLWVENHQNRGANVRIMSCDVTDEISLRKVHQQILQEMPPIAGVVSAAMVLRDVSIRNMEYNQLQDVIRPKVLGSINLDRIFYNVPLDFFIVLSSTNAIIGNPGQANYAAANMGMAGVAIQRRQRGLRASIAHVGAIIGVGYVTNSIERLDLAVTMTNLIRVSEQEVHQMIAEVFEAGFQDSTVPQELIMGLKEVSRSDPGQSKWAYDPKFCRLLLPSPASRDSRGSSGASEKSVREELETCKSEEAISQAVRRAFAAQMRKILFLQLSDEDLMQSTGSVLGLDSLIAVDIRTWILKTFEVSIPVLQIMSTDVRISDIAASTVEELPAHMTPLVCPDQGSCDIASAIPYAPTAKAAIKPRDVSPLRQGSTTLPIDWDREALAPDDLVLHTFAALPSPRDPPEVILLTGATGLLGRHLLDALLEQNSVRQIICIAVRRLSNRLAEGDIPDPTADGRVAYYEGDLSLPHFGLTEPDLKMFSEIDAVIHNGADTSHVKHYATLRNSNVESTRALIRLCVPRKIPFYYISSAGIALACPQLDPFPPISVKESTGEQLNKISRDGARGYMCSKWVCERMLENSHAMYGLPVTIHRPSTIIREAQDAKTLRAEFDWVNALLNYSHIIQAVPHVRHNKGRLDLVYVKTCCADIVSGLFGKQRGEELGLTYWNDVGDIVIPMQELGQIALGGRHCKNEPYEKLEWPEWSQRAMEAGLHPAVAALIETLDELGGPDYPSLVR